MPRRREKTRTDWLAEALELQIKAGETLANLDLRSTRGELKDTLKRIRDLHAKLSKELALALRQDVPAAPLTKRQ